MGGGISGVGTDAAGGVIAGGWSRVAEVHPGEHHDVQHQQHGGADNSPGRPIA
jgi:hypothetical protein